MKEQLFELAKPVWLQGKAEEIHIRAQFRAVFRCEEEDVKKTVCRVATSGIYNLFVNGRFVAYGPARAGKNPVSYTHLILIVAGFAGATTYASRMTLAKGSENFVKALRDKLYAHIQKLPFSWHVHNKTGEIIQRCTSDVEVIRNFITNQLMEVFRTVFLIALSLAIMFSMNVKISLIAPVSYTHLILIKTGH